MKAALWYKAGDIRIEDIPEPSPCAGDVKIKVKWCGICGSDLHEFTMGPIFIPVENPHPITQEVAPVIMGHEFSGEITEVGEGVTNLAVGDRVTVEPLIVCGECPACKAGHYNLCDKLGFHGLMGGGGGLAEYTTFPARFVHKIPDTLSYEKAALVEPMSVGYHSLEVGGFRSGHVAVVAGAGPIGLATIECLKALGAKKIIVVQRKSVRQEYALRAGADILLEPGKDDVVAEIYRLTGGAGADIAFETTGSEQCLLLLLESIKAAGTLVVTSIWEGPATLHPNLLVMKERQMVGSICYCGDFPKVIELLDSGRIPAEGYVTKKICLEDVVKEGFASLTGPEKKSQVKILVTPDCNLL